MRATIASAAGLVFVTASLAQATLDGTWVGALKNPSGSEMPIQVNVTGTTAMWRMDPPLGRAGQANPCASKDMPGSITATEAGAVLEVPREKVIPGCSNLRYRFKMVDGRLETTTQDGRLLVLQRK